MAFLSGLRHLILDVGWLNMTSQPCLPHLCCLSEVTVLRVTLQNHDPGKDTVGTVMLILPFVLIS